MLPDFVIIGAQKSASTFLQACLSDHPDVYIPVGESAVFESPYYERENAEEALARLFAGREEKRLGIKRPSCLGLPEVPARIGSHLPKARLIAVLRNPIDRAVSAYFHNVAYGYLPALDVEIGMRRILEDADFTSQFARSPEVLEFGLYAKHLRQYDAYAQQGRLLILLHEEVLENPLRAVQRAYEFLEVQSDYEPASLNTRPHEGQYNLNRLRLLRLRNRFLFEYNVERTRMAPKEVGRWGGKVVRTINKLDRYLFSRLFANTKPRVSMDLQERLYSYYADDLVELAGRLGRDLSHWAPRCELQSTG